MTKKILQDEESFKKDALSKMSLPELAKKYGMKECTVSKWKHKLNVITVPKNIPLPDKNIFADEIKKYTNKELAKKYNVCIGLISQVNQRLKFVGLSSDEATRKNLTTES